MEDKIIDNKKKVEEPKDELRSKFLSTFKIFDDEGPTIPVEITNVGKPDFNIEDLDPNKKKESLNKVEDDLGLDLDIEVEENPVKNLIIDQNYAKEVTVGANPSIRPEESKSIRPEENGAIPQKNNKGFSFQGKSNSQKEKSSTEDINQKSSLQKHYKVLKFFGRFFTTILDQVAILSITYLYFLLMIKPSMIEIPYKYIEGIMYFIVNDPSSLKSLIIGYFLITFLYYTIFNILFKSTPFNYLLGYKIYRNDSSASVIVLVLRNFVMIPLNLLLFFPYLFLIISDNKQTIYDKIFSTYLLKEN